MKSTKTLENISVTWKSHLYRIVSRLVGSRFLSWPRGICGTVGTPSATVDRRRSTGTGHGSVVHTRHTWPPCWPHKNRWTNSSHPTFKIRKLFIIPYCYPYKNGILRERNYSINLSLDVRVRSTSRRSRPLLLVFYIAIVHTVSLPDTAIRHFPCDSVLYTIQDSVRYLELVSWLTQWHLAMYNRRIEAGLPPPEALERRQSSARIWRNQWAERRRPEQRSLALIDLIIV